MTTIHVIVVNVEFLIPCVPLVLVLNFHDIQKLTASNSELQTRLSADFAEVKRTLKGGFILRITSKYDSKICTLRKHTLHLNNGILKLLKVCNRN